jgi:hypothetical protein
MTRDEATVMATQVSFLTAVIVASLVAAEGCAGHAASQTRPTGQGAVVPFRMPPTPIEFELDARVWHEQNVGASTNPEVVGARSFVRDKASSTAQCPADLVVIGERLPAGVDVAHFSAAKRFGMPPATIESVFGWQDGSIQLVNAVGYRLRGNFGCEPLAYMVHAVEGSYGISIIIEVDPQEYRLIEPEILAILRSFRVPG